MLLATVAIACLGNYVLRAVVVVHLIIIYRLSPYPPPSTHNAHPSLSGAPHLVWPSSNYLSAAHLLGGSFVSGLRVFGSSGLAGGVSRPTEGRPMSIPIGVLVLGLLMPSSARTPRPDGRAVLPGGPPPVLSIALRVVLLAPIPGPVDFRAFLACADVAELVAVVVPSLSRSTGIPGASVSAELLWVSPPGLGFPLPPVLRELWGDPVPRSLAVLQDAPNSAN